MSSKKKLIISLSAVCLVAVIAVVSVVAVLAAGTQAVQTNVTITYTAYDVSATVSANNGFPGTSGSSNLSISDTKKFKPISLFST